MFTCFSNVFSECTQNTCFYGLIRSFGYFYNQIKLKIHLIIISKNLLLFQRKGSLFYEKHDKNFHISETRFEILIKDLVFLMKTEVY